MKFLKLTRLDNTPIWINASFVVTVEPRRDAGSVVVPIGDGLDYDVKESPETVLARLDGAPVPPVVPVPTPMDFASAPHEAPAAPQSSDQKQVSQSPEPSGPAREAPPTPAPKATRTRAKAKTTRTTKKAKAVVEKDLEGTDPAESDSAVSSEETAPTFKEVVPAERPLVERPFKPVLSDEQIERLRKSPPRTVKRLLNTLASQFKVADAESAVRDLETRGVITLELERIKWS